MTTHDPAAPELGIAASLDREFSVEEIAQIDALETLTVEDFSEVSLEALESQNIAEAEQAALENEVPDTTAEALAIPRPAPAPLPITPIPIIKHRVSGRYTNCPRPWKIELRVDVDGFRPMKKVSGDYYYVSGSTTSYYGSFILEAPSISVSSTQVTITGIANTTWGTSYKKLRVVIPRHTIYQPKANAHIQWMTLTNKKGAAYVCLYESPYFRSVDLEQDKEQGVTPFSAYNTGSLPSGGSARNLTVAKAFGEAGVEMRTSGVSNTVATSEAGDSKWSNAELHNAMEKHFSLWKDVPHWKVWLFHAMKHDYGPGLLGIMYDQKGKQRQGCASFYQSISGNTAAKLRDQLYVSVHELGHCFNLFHSFHKKYMKPALPNRPGSLSWMNYPQNFPGGKAAFWNAFPFQFDNLEVVHLRHAFRNNIVMGGNPFGTGAAFENHEAFADNVNDRSGLRLSITLPRTMVYGQPVVANIELRGTDGQNKVVHQQVHPNFGFVQIAVQKPNGEVLVYHPPMEHCIADDLTTLVGSDQAIADSAYIGYDAEHGQIFTEPGSYKLRGIYYAEDGSVILSDATSFQVLAPATVADQQAAELMLGDEQGMLLYLLGSDSPYLQKGNDALDEVAAKFSQHRLAVYAQLVQGFNASRPFKTIQDDNQISERIAQPDKANKLLTSVLNVSKKGAGVDVITAQQTEKCLAQVNEAAGVAKRSRKAKSGGVAA